MSVETVTMNGTIKGRVVELERDAPLPDGSRVTVTLTRAPHAAAVSEIERLCVELRSGNPLREIWHEIEEGRADRQ